MDVILGAIRPCCRDLQYPLSLFGDLNPLLFYNSISGDVETCSIGQYKVVNYRISLIIHHGIKLFILLALSGWVNPITNLVLSPSTLEHSWACQTGMSLRVTKCHRAVIFDGAYLRARARYGCGSSS